MSKEQIIRGVSFPYSAPQEQAQLIAQSVVFPMTAEEAAQMQRVEVDDDEYDDDEYDDGAAPQAPVNTAEMKSEKPVQMIDKDQVQSMIQALGKQNTIVNDQGKEMDFDGDTKEDFIKACEEGYPVIQRTLNSIYEIGKLLAEVRSKLKKKKLYHTWLKFIGLPERTAQNYVQAYDRFTDRLPDFSCLGIKKLLIASKLPEHVEYVEANLERLTQQTAQDFEKEVKALLGKPVTKSGKSETSNKIDMGSYKVTPSQDGSRITIECTSKSHQEKLIEELGELLSN
ncbi:MAG: hypothetical protein ACLP5H_19520 [Desulfomonilaceae bacterium]